MSGWSGLPTEWVATDVCCYGHGNLGSYADDTSTIDYESDSPPLFVLADTEEKNRWRDRLTTDFAIGQNLTVAHLWRVVRGRYTCITKQGATERRLSVRSSSWSNPWIQTSTCGTLLHKTVWHNPLPSTPAPDMYRQRFVMVILRDGQGIDSQIDSARPAGQRHLNYGENITQSVIDWWYRFGERFQPTPMPTVQVVYRVTLRPSEENRPFSIYSP